MTRSKTAPTRKTFLAGAAGTFASIAFVRAPARAAQFTLKWAHAVQLNHPLHVNAVLVKNAVAKRSNGRLAIEIYPNNVLGGDPAMLSQVRTGAIQLYSGYGGIYAAVAPLAGIEGIGFAFHDQPQALAAFDGQLGALVRAEMDEKGPFHTFARPWVNGFRQVTTSTKPIRVVGDMAGLKIRTPPTHIWTDMFSALGAAPTPIAASEMYTALQTHVVDAQENPFTILETYRLFEVQKYISVTNHMWSNFWVVANAQAWQSLPPDLQTILHEEIDAKALTNRRDMQLSEASLADKLVRRGMVLNRVEVGPFRARLASAGFYAKEKVAFGDAAWTALERSVGYLG
ncbi:MAG TPA: TRAP transporter substrate-binding protein [Candidatus Sulfotelmatobacter sp.]|nr:TRAP transporter substrate-binding protein [Candidatus Sulfotelmatobacter sp.]